MSALPQSISHFNSTVSDANWSLRRPAGWQVKQSASGGTALIGPKVGPFHAGVTVDQRDGDLLTMMGLMKALADEQAILPHYECLATNDLSTVDYQAFHLRTAWYHEAANVMMLTQQLFCHCRGQIYVLTASTPNSEHNDELTRVFNKLLSSFRLH